MFDNNREHSRFFFKHVVRQAFFSISEGSFCTHGAVPAKCVLLRECPIAMKQIYLTKTRQHEFKRCTFKGVHEVICCPLNLIGDYYTSTESYKPRIQDSSKSKSKKACEKYSKMFSVPLSTFIYGGRAAELEDFPHMVALGFSDPANQSYSFRCGGTIISEQYVVTAAHCISNIDHLKVNFVRVGVIRIPDLVQDYNSSTDVKVIETTLYPEGYKRVKRHHDIALLKLEKSLIWTKYVRPACLYSRNDNPSALEVTGWGLLEIHKRSEILQRAVLSSVSTEKCARIYSGLKKITSNQICAKDKLNRSDTCKGDSGGPLQIFEKDKTISTIVGITSYGNGCGSRYPGVYTRISSYVSWIENIVW